MGLLSVALAPAPGAVKVTTTPDTGLPRLSCASTTSGAANAVPIPADCDDPLTYTRVVAAPGVLVRVQVVEGGLTWGGTDINWRSNRRTAQNTGGLLGVNLALLPHRLTSLGSPNMRRGSDQGLKGGRPDLSQPPFGS